MSRDFPPPRMSKTSAKRRADRRKRNREIGRYIFAYGVIALLVLGTVSSVFVASVGAPTGVVPTVMPTQPANQGLFQLVTLGDNALAQGDLVGALNFYRGYLDMTPGDTQVQSKKDAVINRLNTEADTAIQAGRWLSATQFLEAYTRERGTDAQAQLKLAKAILGSPQPDYVKAGAALERATKIPDSPVVAEAQALLAQHQSAIATAIAAAPTVTGTVTLTSTVQPSPGVITPTNPISPTTGPATP